MFPETLLLAQMETEQFRSIFFLFSYLFIYLFLSLLAVSYRHYEEV